MDRRSSNLGYFFADSVARYPDRLAVIDLYGGQERRITYAALDHAADQAAGMLQALGIAPGERVGMLIDNRVEFLEIFLGAMRAGAIPVPMNTRLASDTLRFILEDTECAAVFVDPACHADAVAIAAGVPHRIALAPLPGWTDYTTARDASAPLAEPPALAPHAQAFQPYTSGSTGLPKGAMMSHHGMLWYVRYNQRHWPSSPEDRGLIALPLFHKNAMRGTVKPMLFAGGSFVLMPRYEPVAYLQAMSDYRVTFSRGVAAVFTMFLQHRAFLDTLDLSALRSLSIGSASVSAELMDTVRRALPGVKVTESYGLTEGGSPFRAPADGRVAPRGSVGEQGPEIELRLVGDDGRDADEGELWLRSPYNLLGYHKRPEITAEKLVDGWLRTGDRLRRDADGFFFFVCRVDDMFSAGGENIYPKEVEDLLFRHPAVANAVVVPVPHAVKGSVPGAMVVLKRDATATPEALRSFCLEHGPKFAHPRVVRIVPERGLPLNGAGKIDRNQVRALLSSPATE